MIKTPLALLVGIALCLLVIPIVTAGSISWNVGYGSVDPQWQTTIKGINYSPTTTYNITANETLNILLTTTCYTGECGQLIHQLIPFVQSGYTYGRDVIASTSSVVCPALYAAPSSPSSCTFNVSIRSNSTKTFGFNLTVRAVPSGPIATKLTAQTSGVLQLTNHFDFVEKLCSPLTVNQWTTFQLNDLGYSTINSVPRAAIESGIGSYANDVKHLLESARPAASNASFNISISGPTAGDAATVTVTPTGMSEQDAQGSYYFIPSQVEQLRENATKEVQNFDMTPALQTMTVRHGLLFANTSSGFTEIYRSCNPNPSDICAGTTGCCWDGKLYAGGEKVFVNLTTNKIMASVTDKWNMQCVAHSPGNWTASTALTPNTCSPSDYVYCAQDGAEYALRVSYSNASSGIHSYCFDNGSGINFYNIPSAAGYQEIQNSVPEICSGGINSVDNNCNAYLNFVRESGSFNFGKLNVGGKTFSVSQDVDAFDASCAATVTINVSDESGKPIANATITQFLMSPTGTEQEYAKATTASNGLAIFTAPASIFKFVASRSGYNPDSITVKLNYTSTPRYAMTLTQGNCNSDCTTTSNPTLCSAACDGVNGCAFSPGLASFLDGKPVNIYHYISSLNVNVLTCEGDPKSAATGVAASITCPTGKTLLVIERAVLKDGKPVKMVVPICQ